MKLSIGMIVAVASLTVACAPPPPNHYSVAVSTMFTVDQQEAIVRGLDSWTAAVKELTLDVAVSECHEGALCVLPVAMSGAVVGSDYEGDGSNVIGIDIVKLVADAKLTHTVALSDVVARTVAHEMGHRMIDPDHTAPGTLMARDTLHQAQAPTATDVARWHEVRR